MAIFTTLCTTLQDAAGIPSFSYKWQQRHQTTHGERHYTLQKSSRCCRYTQLLPQMTAEASDTTWLDNRLWTAAVSSWLSLSSFPGLQTHVVAKTALYWEKQQSQYNWFHLIGPDAISQEYMTFIWRAFRHPGKKFVWSYYIQFFARSIFENIAGSVAINALAAIVF